MSTHCTYCQITWAHLKSTEGDGEEVYEVCPECGSDMHLIETVGDGYVKCEISGEITHLITGERFENNKVNINNMETLNKPQELEIVPGSILILSKTNAQAFHDQMKTMIKDTGYGLFEYLEVIKFFEKVKEYISGSSQSKIPEDKEFLEMVRDEVKKYEGGKATTPRGIKIELAETGTAYDFSKCEDPELIKWEGELKELQEKIKAKKDFLKTIPAKGVEIHVGDGELVTVYPPAKSSKSSYKITLPK